jgi:DNA-directed RNA polymerase alpha subunit
MTYCAYVDNIETESDLELDDALDYLREVLEESPESFVRLDPMIEDEEEDEDYEGEEDQEEE